MKQTTLFKSEENSLAHGTLTANQLKIIAIIAMVIDHIAVAYVSFQFFPVLSTVLQGIGGITIPIMSFFVAEGYFHTRNLRRYMSRLAVFALISHIPFVYFENLIASNGTQWGVFTWRHTSVIFTLLCGLLALTAWYRIKVIPVRLIVIVALCGITALEDSDWAVWAVLMVLIFGIFHEKFNKQCLSLFIIEVIVQIWYSIIHFPLLLHFGFLGLLLPLPLLARYNGEKGGSPETRWLFYVFYPLQFLVIYAIGAPIFWPVVGKLIG